MPEYVTLLPGFTRRTMAEAGDMAPGSLAYSKPFQILSQEGIRSPGHTFKSSF